VASRLDALVAESRRSPPRDDVRWSESDAWVICYPDQFGADGLAAVGDALDALGPAINGVHLLPFHPSSGDGGFSVRDHGVVDPAFGTWADVERLAIGHRLMADAVVNHVSAGGVWFQAHLAGDRERADFFREVPLGTDLDAVRRPRATPLTTRFGRTDGSFADYWTTFGPDQVDLDYRSPEVLLAVFEAVFRYVRHGAAAVRLDAVAFLWKDPTTASLHLEQTHTIVALLRNCLEEIDPSVVLITETNVPHADNVAYLGSVDRPEAHAVYQFTLAPLMLHAIQTGDVSPLRRWLSGVDQRPGTTVLNFLASHDGVGLRPADGWLRRSQIDDLAERCREVGGRVGEAAGVASVPEPYELIATWRSLCSAGRGSPFSEDELVARHLATHSVALALRGLPLLYVHSLVGSMNDHVRASGSGIARDLNRGRFGSAGEFEAELVGDGNGSAVWAGLSKMLHWRRGRGCFHPDAAQRVWPDEGPVLVVERRARNGDRALIVTNLGGSATSIEIGPGWRTMDRGEAVASALEIGPWGWRWFAGEA
jgi:glucosylglycerate phosphorylase